MSIQTLAVMAKHESHMISERVKATLAVRRARDDVFRCDRKLMPRAVTNEATERRMVENRRVPAFVISPSVNGSGIPIAAAEFGLRSLKACDTSNLPSHLSLMSKYRTSKIGK
jgi:hypothetical protein